MQNTTPPKFMLTTRQWSRYIHWKKKQEEFYKSLDPHSITKRVSVDVTFMFTPTSVGTNIQVKNTRTGETLDLTEYENW